MKSQLLVAKDPDAGKDWGQEEKRATEDEMAGWHHQLNAQEFEQTLGDSGGQGSLVCRSPWGCKELDTMEHGNTSKNKDLLCSAGNSISLWWLLWEQNPTHSGHVFTYNWINCTVHKQDNSANQLPSNKNCKKYTHQKYRLSDCPSLGSTGIAKPLPHCSHQSPSLSLLPQHDWLPGEHRLPLPRGPRVFSKHHTWKNQRKEKVGRGHTGWEAEGSIVLTIEYYFIQHPGMIFHKNSKDPPGAFREGRSVTGWAITHHAFLISETPTALPWHLQDRFSMGHHHSH